MLSLKIIIRVFVVSLQEVFFILRNLWAWAQWGGLRVNQRSEREN